MFSCAAPKLGLFHIGLMGNFLAVEFSGNKIAVPVCARAVRYLRAWRNAHAPVAEAERALAEIVGNAPPKYRRDSNCRSRLMNCHVLFSPQPRGFVACFLIPLSARCVRCRPLRPRPGRCPVSTHREKGHDPRRVARLQRAWGQGFRLIITLTVIVRPSERGPSPFASGATFFPSRHFSRRAGANGSRLTIPVR